MTTTNNKKNNNTNDKKQAMPTKETTAVNNRVHGGKGTAKNNGEEPNKSPTTATMTKQATIQQDRTKCAAAGKCKAVQGMPLATHHRCAICAFCMHGDCGVELKATERNKIVSTSHRAICLTCIDRIQAGRLLKLDQASNTHFISLGQHKVFKLIRKDYPPIQLIDPVLLSSSDDSSSNSSNSSKSSDHPSDIEIVDKPTKAPKAPAKKHQTNSTTSNKTKPKPNNQKKHQKEVPDEIDIEDNIEDDDTTPDDATVDAGNSKATPLSSTPKNASTTISKKYMDVQIRIDKIKTTKPIDAINACRDRCKTWLEEIQQIEPSFKLHPVDPDNQNQTILHAMKDFPKDLTDLKVFFKNARPIMKGGMLYLKILASFEGDPEQLLSKVIWYHKDRKERIAVSPIQASEVALLG